MSGHSKWKTIQHKKGLADRQTRKTFSKMSKELMVWPDREEAIQT